jgi:hypothetical protein
MHQNILVNNKRPPTWGITTATPILRQRDSNKLNTRKKNKKIKVLYPESKSRNPIRPSASAESRKV